jgi:hypothetical protein
LPDCTLESFTRNMLEHAHSVCLIPPIFETHRSRGPEEVTLSKYELSRRHVAPLPNTGVVLQVHAFPYEPRATKYLKERHN